MYRVLILRGIEDRDILSALAGMGYSGTLKELKASLIEYLSRSPIYLDMMTLGRTWEKCGNGLADEDGVYHTKTACLYISVGDYIFKMVSQ